MRRELAHRVLCRLGLFAVALGGIALGVPGVASAANPACGSTVKHNVKLTSDMSCPGTSGIVVGKSGITINLNHFAIEGDGTFDTTGIDNSGGYNGVTVENGTVEDFGEGIIYYATIHGTINKMVSADNDDDGIDFYESQNGLVEHSKANHNGEDGIDLEENVDVTISGTRADGNHYAGIIDGYSLDTIDRDTMNANQEFGFEVYEPLTHSTSKGRVYYTIEHSVANHDSYSGFQIEEDSPHWFFQANVFGNTAKNDGSGYPPGESSFGWGFFAASPVKGNKNNGALDNHPGNCHDVPCHKL